MSLSYVLAASRCARNIILLGDPQQLEQPQRGAHPEGSDVSALTYLLDGHATIQSGRGLFLSTTRRLSPALCKFTSELFYEGKLVSRPGLDRKVRTAELEDQLLAGCVQPVLREDPLECEHRRPLEPRVGIAPGRGAGELAGLGLGHVDATRESDEAIAHDRLPVEAKIDAPPAHPEQVYRV